jgi:cystathionine beta-lyase/cystathionine gamma-synthase
MQSAATLSRGAKELHVLPAAPGQSTPAGSPPTRPVAAEAKPDADVLRLSIGLEDPEDLCADLGRALDEASRP